MFSNTRKLCLKLFKILLEGNWFLSTVNNPTILKIVTIFGNISCEEIPLFFDWKAEYSNPGQCPKKTKTLARPYSFHNLFFTGSVFAVNWNWGVTDKERHWVYIFMIVSFNATVFENPVLSIKLCNGELVAVRKTVLYDICMTRRNASTRITFLGDTTRIDLIFHG